MPETILNCDVSILHHDGESNADAATRLAGLLDSELCHLADHEISVRARGPAVPFWYDTPEGTIKIMAVDEKDAEAFIYGKYPKNDVSHATDPAPSKPARVFWTRTALGPLPDGYDDIYVYVPGLGRIVHVSEGTGDNLLKEDADEGYVDYLNYTCYELDGGVEESEGGMVLFRSLIHDKFHCLGEALPMVFEEAYGDSVQGFVLLSTGSSRARGPRTDLNHGTKGRYVMLKTIAAIHNGGGNDKLALIITLDYDHEKHPDFDPEAAIRAAAADYLHTNQGKSAMEDTCGNFNYGDFVNYVPDHVNKKHGFVIQEVNIVSIVTDHNEDLRPDDMR